MTRERSETRASGGISLVDTGLIPESLDSETWNFVPGFAHLSSQQTVIPSRTMAQLYNVRLNRLEARFEPWRRYIEDLYLNQQVPLNDVMEHLGMDNRFYAS